MNENLKVPSNLKGSGAADFVTYSQRDVDMKLEDVYDAITKVAMDNPGNIRRIYGSIKEIATKIIRVVLMENEDAIKVLEDKKFDLAVVDGFFMTKHKYLIPHRLNVPFVSLVDVVEPWVARVPWLPSFVPLKLMPFSDRLTFIERVQNLFIYIVAYCLPLAPQVPQDIMGHYGVESLDELVRESELWISTTDPILDYPRPAMPNMIAAGGISTHPAKPLTEEWRQVVEQAHNGIVLVSFGAIASNFPKETSLRLLEAFGQLKQTVIWRFTNNEGLHIPSNVFISDWIPQNDLLGQPRVKVFITHCGNNGQYEAIYHGVPMVGMPILTNRTTPGGWSTKAMVLS
jgi:glucuronosyltransferase